MAQSFDFNLQVIPAFWPIHTIEPHTQWCNRIEQFHLAITVKENIDIDNLKNPVELEAEIPILEGAQDSETETQRKARKARNKEIMKVYENAED